MNIRFVVLSAVCMAYLAPASGFSLLAAGAAAKLGFVKGAVLGAGLAGLSRPASETVIINAESNKPVEVQSSPVQVVSYQPIQTIPVPQPQGIFSSVWNVIQNAIISKTRAVGSLIGAFTSSAPAPQQLIIVVNNTDTTTTTTTTEKPVVFEIVGVAKPKQEEVVPVLINGAPCLTCYY